MKGKKKERKKVVVDDAKDRQDALSRPAVTGYFRIFQDAAAAARITSSVKLISNYDQDIRIKYVPAGRGLLNNMDIKRSQWRLWLILFHFNGRLPLQHLLTTCFKPHSNLLAFRLEHTRTTHEFSIQEKSLSRNRQHGTISYLNHPTSF